MFTVFVGARESLPCNTSLKLFTASCFWLKTLDVTIARSTVFNGGSKLVDACLPQISL